MLNHPLKNGAKAREEKEECDRTELGIIPHQVRGDLSGFNVNVMYGECFGKCTACSDIVVSQYKSDPV